MQTTHATIHTTSSLQTKHRPHAVVFSAFRFPFDNFEGSASDVFEARTKSWYIWLFLCGTTMLGTMVVYGEGSWKSFSTSPPLQIHKDHSISSWTSNPLETSCWNISSIPPVEDKWLQIRVTCNSKTQVKYATEQIRSDCPSNHVSIYDLFPLSKIQTLSSCRSGLKLLLETEGCSFPGKIAALLWPKDKIWGIRSGWYQLGL